MLPYRKMWQLAIKLSGKLVPLPKGRGTRSTGLRFET